MSFDDFCAILYLLSIPLFVVGLIVLIVQAVRKKKKKVPVIIIVVSVLMCVCGIMLPGIAELRDISTDPSYNVSGDEITYEIAETVAKQKIVNLCCDESGVSSVNITYGTFTYSDYYSGGYEFEAMGTYLPVDDYGMYGNMKKFNIRLVVDDSGDTNVLVESFSSAY